jgi:hypothetical protein
MKYYGIQNEVKSYINRLQSEQGITVSSGVLKTLNDRVESLKKSGVWSQFSLGFNDADGDAYLSRAGVTDVIGRAEVLWFTRGMKALNLWNSIVCWPMRNYQNAGNGATVYSLGGLGIYNGNMINSPGWGINGISFSNPGVGTNTERINLSTALGTSGINSFTYGAASINSIANFNRILDIQNGTATGRNPFLTLGYSNQQEFQLPNTPSGIGVTLSKVISFDAFNSIIGSKVDNLVRVSLNASLTDTATTTAAGFVTPATTTESAIRFFNGTIAISLLGRFDAGTALVTIINNLYKSTLGNGLGLP